VAGPKIKKVTYQFARLGIEEGAALSPVKFVVQHVSELLGLAPEAVRAVAKNRISGGEDFQLTCYDSRGNSDYSAMILAARVILPHLAACRLSQTPPSP
jgi:hypothetical protein